MAQRFGGKYSPDGAARRDGAKAPAPQNPYDTQKPARAGARSNLLFILPLAFAVQAFRQDPGGLALGLAATGLLLAAAWLTRVGIRAHEAYDQRRIARRPAFPRKIAASLLTGAGLVLFFVLLNLEAWSLLIGSVLLFLALAGVMYATRKVDWGSVGRREVVSG